VISNNPILLAISLGMVEDGSRSLSVPSTYHILVYDAYTQIDLDLTAKEHVSAESSILAGMYVCHS
jgi:hypothetical protein